jgi:hypothetical protein
MLRAQVTHRRQQRLVQVSPQLFSHFVTDQTESGFCSFAKETNARSEVHNLHNQDNKNIKIKSSL